MHKSAFLLWLAGVSVAFAQQYSITTVAGGAPSPTPISAVNATIGQPRRVALDSAGNAYFSSGNSVYKLSGSTLTLLAGNSRPGFSGDGGSAVNAQLNAPQGIAADASGNVYIADSLNNRIRIVTPDGLINTFAGNGSIGYINAWGDGGPANQAQLYLPSGVAADSKGNVYIADTGNNLVRLVTPDGNINRFAGIGYPGFAGDASAANAASLNHPEDVALDTSGNVYIADTLDAAIRKVTTDGIINTIAGNGSIGFSGDGGIATSAGLIEPFAVAVDSSGNFYIAESSDGRIRKVDTHAVINTVAGTGTLGFAGDNGPATSAQLNLPSGVAVDSSGNFYIADALNNRIRKVTGANIGTVAGNGGFSYSGDNGPAMKAQLNNPQAVAVDAAGNMFIADAANNVVRKVATDGTITTVLGNGTPGTGNSQLNGPQGIAVDNAGNVYVSDTQNARVMKISGGSAGVFAGNGTPGFGGDNGAAASAQLNIPLGLAVDNAGNLYIADFLNQRVRKVTPGGAISTVAGNGTEGYSGDGGPATAAELDGPSAVAVDGAGNLYIADTNNSRIRLVSGGAISTIAGTGTPGYTGDGGPATKAQIANPSGIAVDTAGSLYISDSTTHVRKILSNGPIFTIAGNGMAAYSGDGGLAVNAAMNAPMGLTVGPKSNVYVADSGNNAIRLLQATGSTISIAAVVNAASNLVGDIAPGEVLVIYGSGLGPAQVISNQFNSAGLLPATLAGTTVYVNNAPAPLLYTSATQVSAIVPFGTTGSTAQFYVAYNGQVSAIQSQKVAAAAPGIFTGDFSGKGQAAAVNQDGSVNDASHPAKAGSYISLYLTGGGQTNPPGQDGTVPVLPVLPQSVLPVSATIGGKPATLQYAGGAANIVAGVWQINLQVPSGLTPGAVPVIVTLGTGSATFNSQNNVTITVN